MSIFKDKTLMITGGTGSFGIAVLKRFLRTDNRDLNYDKFFKEGDTKRVLIDEFNSNNTRRLYLEETKAKIASLEYIQNELKGIPNVSK